MGLARIRKPKGLVSREVRSEKTRFESAIQIGLTHKRDQIGTTPKCDQQVRLPSAINRCDSKVQSIES